MTRSLAPCPDCPFSRGRSAPALHVGITGHRPHRLPTDLQPLREKMAEVWEWIRAQRGPDTASELHIWSALAEGIDRLAIEAAIVHTDYALHAVLPCEQSRYEADFSADNSLQAPGTGSIDEFRRILAGDATYSDNVSVVAASHRRDAENHYEGAGETIVDACDLLLAVYDGGARAAGGSGDVVRAAQLRNKPTITIDPYSLDTFYCCGYRESQQPIQNRVILR